MVVSHSCCLPTQAGFDVVSSHEEAERSVGAARRRVEILTEGGLPHESGVSPRFRTIFLAREKEEKP